MFTRMRQVVFAFFFALACLASAPGVASEIVLDNKLITGEPNPRVTITGT